MLALLSSLAKVEAQKISERTKAGMARAKAKGMKIGRPRLGVQLRRQIAQRAAKGETAYGIAKALGFQPPPVRDCRMREEFVPHCSESCRRALQWEQWAVVRLMWKELLRARDVSRRN